MRIPSPAVLPSLLLPVLSLALGIVLGVSPPARAAVLSPGDLVVVDGCGGAAAARVLRIDPGSGAQEIVSQAGLLTQPVGVALDAAGRILVSDSESGTGGAVLRIDPATGGQTQLSTGFTALWDLDVEESGSMLVTDLGSSTAIDTVFRIGAAGGAPTVVSAGGGFDFLQSIAIGPGPVVYVSDAGLGGRILSVNPVTGAQGLVSAGFGLPTGIDVEPSGQIIVADATAAQVIRVNPGTGAASLVSSGGELVFPFGVTAAPSGTLFVSDWGDGQKAAAVVRVNPTTGAQTVVASAGFLDQPCGITTVPEPGAPLTAAAAGLALATLTARRRRTS